MGDKTLGLGDRSDEDEDDDYDDMLLQKPDATQRLFEWTKDEEEQQGAEFHPSILDGGTKPKKLDFLSQTIVNADKAEENIEQTKKATMDKTLGLGDRSDEDEDDDYDDM